MKINKIVESPKPASFGHKIDSKVFYQNKVGSRIVNKITLDNGKSVYVDTTNLHNKILCKFLTLYDQAGHFVRSIAKSYNNGKLTNTRHINWE